MANLKGHTLFFITSPRTPMKMLPEIEILTSNFAGQLWNKTTQTEFMKRLIQDPAFEGSGSSGDMAFSARDRINRGPKALGFVDIKPTISLTNAGKNFLNVELSNETLLRQLLKFQLPSPFHAETAQTKGTFFVKPYLELFRLIYVMGKITFDELMIFGLQLTDYSKFDQIITDIKAFRKARQDNSDNYRVFVGKYRDKEIANIYQYEILNGQTQTRQSKDISIDNFIKTKVSNMHDYADACFRYLRATGMVSISQRGKSLSILPEKKEDVKYFLDNVDRRPIYIDDEVSYKAYLFDATLPKLYTDDRVNLEQEVKNLNILSIEEIQKISTLELKKRLRAAISERKERVIKNQVSQLKTYQSYVDIINVYNDIKAKNFYDVPLMLEWNTWRAMTMLDGGEIHANLKFDDNGEPMSTASGNMADIVCDYGDFSLAVEVTMQLGQRQYEAEGEPVSRHLANIKKNKKKEAYCFFIAPQINDACIAHFYTLHLTNIAYYGGKSIIIPIELETFKKMIEQSGKAKYVPNPEQVRKLCKYSMDVAQKAKNESEWYNEIKNKALNWPAM